MEFEQIRQLIQSVSDSSLSGFALEEGNLKLTLTKGPLSGAPAAGIWTPGVSGAGAPAAGVSEAGIAESGMPALGAPAGTSAEDGADSGRAEKAEAVSGIGGEAEGTLVKSPLVGTYYASAEPGAEPYVSVGDSVKAGQVLGLVEAMKLMNEIESECGGTVKAIYVENGQLVEYGQPMFLIG